MIREPGLEPAAIRAAHARIDPVFTHSPQYVHEGLSARLGVPVIVKIETANPIRSFKGRGTAIAVGGLAGEGRIGPDRPVACVSAGTSVRASRTRRARWGSRPSSSPRGTRIVARSRGCAPSVRTSINFVFASPN